MGTAKSSRQQSGAVSGSGPGAGKPGKGIGIDWLAGTFERSVREADEAKRLAFSVSGGRLPFHGWLPSGGGRHGWRYVWTGPAGAQLWTDHPTYGAHLSLPGQACELLGLKALLSVASALEHSSRIDLRLDDYRHRQTPQELLERLRNKDPGVVTKARNPARYSGDLGTGGLTVYVGSTASDRQLRCYDKRAESGGKVDSIRWELQTRRGASEAVRRDLVQANYDLIKVGEIVCGTLRGFITFRTPGEGVHKDYKGSREHLEQWQDEAWWD